MLQNDAVRNLHFESEIRVTQQPRGIFALQRTFCFFFYINFIIQLSRICASIFNYYLVLNGLVSVTSQATASTRTPLPISTVGQNNGTYLPLSGYGFLVDLPSVHIEQTFELNDSLTSITTENRFVVRSPLGDAIYAATESSTEKNRLLCGSARPFQMHIIDKTFQEAMLLHKKLSLGLLCGQSKSLEVWIPPGNILGRIVKSCTLTAPDFFIEDGTTNAIIFYIEASANSKLCCCCLSKNIYFKIHSGGDLRASIDRKWSTEKSQYTTNIYFSDSKLNAKDRALILGAAFFLEYQYFQTRF